MISASVSASVSVSGSGSDGLDVCLRFTMAISQFSVDSLSQVTEGRTCRG